MARNRAFTPFNPSRAPGGVPARITTDPATERELQRRGVLPEDLAARERHGADYPESTPQIVQQQTSLDDNLATLIAGGLIQVAAFRMFKNTVGDRLRFWMQTENPDTFDLLRFQMRINGQPFIQQQFFTQPFIQNMQGFFRRIRSQASVELIAGLRPGAIPIAPIGTMVAQIFVDGYQGKFE